MNEDDEWLTISAAARRLGVTRGAIQGRIKRRTIETKPFGNHGILVRVPRDVAPSQQLPSGNLAATWHANSLRADLEAAREQLIEHDRQITIQAAEIAGLKAERDGLVARLGDRDKQLDQSCADAERERADRHSEVERLRLAHAAEIARLTNIIERRDREAERMQVLLQAEQQQVKALTDQRQHPPDPPKPRWRRWFGR